MVAVYIQITWRIIVTKRAACILILLLLPPVVAVANPSSPYAGQETRRIKALSDSDTEDYLTGKGMGFAKAAELNHYPGPRHVLDLAGPLGLTKTQRSQTERLFAKMQEGAIRLGKQIVEKELELDKLFSSGAVNESGLHALITEIARLQGELRFVHLKTHLAQKMILTDAQVRTYDSLRGYAANTHRRHNHSH